MRDDRQIGTRTDRALIVGCLIFAVLLVVIVLGVLMAFGAI